MKRREKNQVRKLGKTILITTGVMLMGLFSLFGRKAPEALAENVEGYVALDAADPVEFGGDHIVYGGETITLSEKAIYIDGSLSDEMADRYKHVYNDFVEAAAAFKDGTEEEPMKVYIAPYVYWIDDPDDEEIRTASGGDTPYGLVINCDNLHLIGLTKNPYHVVLAVNRGQTQGAKGNYTMFYIDGRGTRTENLTMGNYCNVDLEYPLMPELSRAKRAEAITQSQLVITNGDKVVAKNCNFISRLNACPFVGSVRALFEDCHIECGDDALPGTAVFLNCTVRFTSSKPFYNTTGTGAVFLNCKITSDVQGTQYLTKAGGTVTLVDCAFFSDHPGFKIEWTPEPAADLKCVQGNIILNGEPYVIAEGSANTIDVTGTEAIKAFVLNSGETTIYNTYNLLQGNDGWDPLGNKAEVAAVGETYTLYPFLMNTAPSVKSVKNGETGTIKVVLRNFRNVAGGITTDTVEWWVDEALKDYVSITPKADGSCDYTILKSEDTNVTGRIYVRSSMGYFASTFLNITPDVVGAPGFAEAPKVSIGKTAVSAENGAVMENGVALQEEVGCVTVSYMLNKDAQDISVIDWYRVSGDGAEKVKVATSRLDAPEYTYILTPGDVGYYIMAEVTPKTLNSQPGTKQSATTERVVTAEDMPRTVISTNFQNFPTEVQNEVKPGFWTVEGFKPLDTAEYDWKAKTGEAWAYTEGEGGAKNVYGLTQTVRGSRILYTPVAGNYGDMMVTLQVAPCKSAGQGFGSATAQYMDVLIKMDTEKLNGYALRIERTSKYSNAVDFKLVKYTNGMTEAISDPVSASCYNTTCTITMTVEGNVLTAHAETTKKQNDEQAAAGLAHQVDLKAKIEPNAFGGVGVTHTGTTGGNATLLTKLDVSWKEGSAGAEEPIVTPAETPVPEEKPVPKAVQTPEGTDVPEVTVALNKPTEVTEAPEPTMEADCGMEQTKVPAKDSGEVDADAEIKPGKNKAVLGGIVVMAVAVMAIGVVVLVQKKKKH